MLNEKMSLSSRNLKYKLRISFYLMSVLPLLVCLYLISNYLVLDSGLNFNALATLFISGIIALSGFFVVKEIFDRIVVVSSEAKMIAAGDIGRTLPVQHPDEVGDLGSVLNQLTLRIRTNMTELKSYSEKSAQINLEIQKRIVIFNGLLQISSLISEKALLDDVLRISLEKALFLGNSSSAFLLMKRDSSTSFAMKHACGEHQEALSKISIEATNEIVQKIIRKPEFLVFDSKNTFDKTNTLWFYDQFKLKNALIFPVSLGANVIGLFGIGNSKDDFLYGAEDIELLEIIVKQIAIAIENDVLTRKIEKLEVKDYVTGLYNAVFMRNRLQEEIRRAVAYQRPCSFVLFDVDNYKSIISTCDPAKAESLLKRIAYTIRDGVTEIDRVGRIDDDAFAIIVPEKNKRQAHTLAETIRAKIAECVAHDVGITQPVTVSAGVSENPLDGTTAEELMSRADELLKISKKQGKNKVTGITEPPLCR